MSRKKVIAVPANDIEEAPADGSEVPPEPTVEELQMQLAGCVQ